MNDTLTINTKNHNCKAKLEGDTLVVKTAPYPNKKATDNYNLICKEVHLHKDSKLAKWWKEIWPEPSTEFGSFSEFMRYVHSKDSKLYTGEVVDTVEGVPVTHMDLAQALFVEWNMFLEACGCKRIDGRL